MIVGLNRATWTKREAVFGDNTAVRASRLTQSRPRYIARWARTNWRSAGCSPRRIFTIAFAARSPERNVRLQCNALALGARQEVAQPSHGGIASVRSDYHTRGERLPHDVDPPIFGGGPIERDQGCFLANFGPECARPIKKKMVEKTPLDRDLAVIAARKIDAQLLAADGNKFHCVEGSVRTVPNFLLEFESLQHGPAGRIDTIATDFFSRKFFPLQD